MVSHGETLPHAVLVKELATVAHLLENTERITYAHLDIEFEKPNGKPGSYQLVYCKRWAHAHPEREPVAKLFVKGLRTLLLKLKEKLENG